MRILFLVLLLSVASSFRYCNVEESDYTLFTTPTEFQQIRLSKHFLGYNLNYSSSNPEIVDIFQPYKVVEQQAVALKSGYIPINVDAKNSNQNLWGRDGVLVAQEDGNNVGLGYGKFTNDLLPNITNYNYYTLPSSANCYSGKIYDNNFNVIIDCQDQWVKQDLLCNLGSNGSTNCQSYPSITRTGQRISVVLEIDQQSYLLSAATTQDISSSFQNETFINIYHILPDGPDFNLIVDRHALGLQSLSITDMKIVKINGIQYIMVSDLYSKLILFRYMSDNTVADVQVKDIEGKPYKFQISAYGDWIVATDSSILAYTYNEKTSTLNLQKKYQIDPSDNKATDIQSSLNHIMMRTSNNIVYTYDKQYTELNYLLNRQQINPNTVTVVSPFYPRIFQINSTFMQSIAITSGYLYIGKVDTNSSVTITANSGNLTCKLNLNLQVIQDDSKVYKKKDMLNGYKIQNGETITFPLNSYFGGSNLQYTIKDELKGDFSVWIEHVDNHKQDYVPSDNVTMYKIIEIDAQSYWFITFSDESIRFFVCLNNDTMTFCSEQTSQKIDLQGRKVKHAESGKKTDGSLVLGWTYQESIVGIKTLGSRGFTMIFTYGSIYSSLVVGMKYICFVEKVMNKISFYDGNWLEIITKNNFNDEQLAMLGGFYPREVIASSKNENMFFIKFPLAIVTVAYLGEKNIEILNIWKVRTTFIPEDEWDFVVGTDTFLLFMPEGITEYVQLPDSTMEKLHMIKSDGNPILPALYQSSLDTALFATDSGFLQYISLNSNSIDSKYYKIAQPTNGASWAVSESWLFFSTGDVHYFHKKAALAIISNTPDSTDKQDLSIDLKVASEGDASFIHTNITSLNYPAVIKQTQTNDNLQFPSSADNTQIDFDLSKYFTGSTADVTISCPYCLSSQIKLEKPFQFVKDNDDVSEFDDIIAFPDHSGVITLNNNTLTISSLRNKAESHVNFESEGICKWMDINQYDIIVFCISPEKQEIVWLEVDDDCTDINYKSTYSLPQDGIIWNPFEIGCYSKNDSLTVLIHDKGSSSVSSIKKFQISDSIEYLGEIDSSTFGVIPVQTINSMSILDNHLLLTIGGVGLGYLNLQNIEQSQQFINLASQADIASDILDNSAFLRVSLYNIDENSGLMEVFVTTSNFYHYLINLQEQPGRVSYAGVKETYNKYAHQQSLNWVLLNDEHVILAYYNKSTSSQTLALYKRSGTEIVNFFTSAEYTVSGGNVHPPKALLIDVAVFEQKSSLLFIEEPAMPSADAKLGLYNITGKYALMANYDQGGNFDSMEVTARNSYYSVSRNVGISFDGDDSKGLKWYSVLIVVCLVLLAVGIAFGMFLKMKAKKKDSKKVSLFTESEEIDEVI